jgi:hypothetical protein
MVAHYDPADVGYDSRRLASNNGTCRCDRHISPMHDMAASPMNFFHGPITYGRADKQCMTA